MWYGMIWWYMVIWYICELWIVAIYANIIEGIHLGIFSKCESRVLPIAHMKTWRSLDSIFFVTNSFVLNLQSACRTGCAPVWNRFWKFRRINQECSHHPKSFLFYTASLFVSTGLNMVVAMVVAMVELIWSNNLSQLLPEGHLLWLPEAGRWRSARDVSLPVRRRLGLWSLERCHLGNPNWTGRFGGWKKNPIIFRV